MADDFIRRIAELNRSAKRNGRTRLGRWGSNKQTDGPARAHFHAHLLETAQQFVTDGPTFTFTEAIAPETPSGEPHGNN